MQTMRGPRRGDHTLSSPRVVIYSTILVASLVPPVYLFVRSFLLRDASDAVVAVVCGVLYLLMLSRLWDVASSHRRGLVRERTLRMAGASLASATAGALRLRGVSDPAASLAAETGIAVFKIAFARWVTDPGERPLAPFIRESMDELKLVAAG